LGDGVDEMNGHTAGGDDDGVVCGGPSVFDFSFSLAARAAEAQGGSGAGAAVEGARSPALSFETGEGGERFSLFDFSFWIAGQALAAGGSSRSGAEGRGVGAKSSSSWSQGDGGGGVAGFGFLALGFCFLIGAPAAGSGGGRLDVVVPCPALSGKDGGRAVMGLVGAGVVADWLGRFCPVSLLTRAVRKFLRAAARFSLVLRSCSANGSCWLISPL